ncbi:MAG: chemotaxis protein CheW [Tepidisphaeraceae bacterium]
MAGQASQAPLVLFSVDSQTYALPANSVLEMLSMVHGMVTHVPRCPKSVLGVFNNRGQVVPVYDAHVVLGRPGQDELVKSLSDMLAAREQDHVAWLEALRHSVRSGAEFTKARDPSQCAFGKWYHHLMSTPKALNELTGGDMSLRRLLQHLDEPHRQIHGLADRVLALTAEHKKEEAEQLIQQTWDQQLGSMRKLFAQLLSDFAVLRNPILMVVRHGRSTCALAVDQVMSVTSACKPIDENQTRVECPDPRIRQFLQHENGALVMVTSVDLLLGDTIAAAA